MKCSVKKLIGWDQVLNTARTTVGKSDIYKEPSDNFKKSILLAEHSPIRNLTFEVVWEDIPYWVAMHVRTHHNGFKSSEDDLYFVTTQRSDRTQKNRNKMTQDSIVNLKVVLNAQSIINVSRVRLCKKAAKETIKCWQMFLNELEKIEPILVKCCVPNCIYRRFCPETKNSCGFDNSDLYHDQLENFMKFTEEIIDLSKGSND